MKNKIFKAALASAVTLVLAVSPVLAVAETSNDDITDHSYSHSVARDRDDMTVDNRTVGTDFVNVDVALANTGLNRQNRNEDDNMTESSDADAFYATANFANVNETEFDEGNGAHASNARVDDHSGDPCVDDSCDPCDSCDGEQTDDCDVIDNCPVYAEADDSDTYRVGNTNRDTALKNITASVANTGLNRQNRNEDANSMTAGGAVSTAGASNVVNDNYSKIGSDDSGSADASNEDITDHSYAKAVATDNDLVEVDNKNDTTDVENITASVANSGLNNQSRNEDENDMETGAVDSLTETANFVNVNETQVNTGGGAEASNDDADDHSYAESEASDDDTVEVSNKNKDTTVRNISVSVANSGGNRQRCNEDGNTMRTGSAIATGTTTNVVNGNQTYVGEEAPAGSE